MRILLGNRKEKTVREETASIAVPVAEEQRDPLSEFAEALAGLSVEPEAFGRQVLSLIAKELEIIQGIFLLSDLKKEQPGLHFLAGYACVEPASGEGDFLYGEGLPGQVAQSGKLMNIKEIPQGYITVRTGLGEAMPNALILFPLIFDSKLYGVIELASFHSFTEKEEAYLEAIASMIGESLKNILGKKKAKTKDK